MKLILGIFLALLVPTAGIILTDAPVIWPISALLYSFGLLYSFSLGPRRIAKIIAYLIIATILFLINSAFFFSYYLQNTGFNDAFFYHLKPDLFYAGVNEYLLIILLITACFLFFLIISSYFLAKETSKWGWKHSLALILLILGLFISPSERSLAYYVAHISPEEKEQFLYENFNELLGPKATIQFSKSEKPNIVLIYAESLEQRYFDETIFPGLMPQLKRLREQSIDFSNVSQGPGSLWTVAGMVASQCGFPLTVYHDIDDENFGLFDEFLPKAICIGDLLKKDDYNLTFIGAADARFAAKGNFLRSHGYKEILDRDDLAGSLDDKSYLNYWGVFDDTLFQYAFEKFLSMSRAKSPFMITLLTIDTHHPNGFLSKSCARYGSGQNSSLNSVHCSDQLIPRFIEQIRNSPYSENTVIIVLSDHLALRNQATSLLESSQMPRRLTFFVNTPEIKMEKNATPGTLYDIAPTILDLIGYNIKGQIGFGSSLTKGPGYLPGKFGEDEWEKKSANLLAIGKTLWNNDVTLDPKGIQFSVSDLSLTLGNRKFDLRVRGGAGGLKIPMSSIFIFDENSLKLKKIKTYSLYAELTPETLSNELLENKEKLAMVIGRAGNLPGFSDPRNHPDQWVFFLGKPGSDQYINGPITGELLIPYDKISKLRQSKMDGRILSERVRMAKVTGSSSTAAVEVSPPIFIAHAGGAIKNQTYTNSLEALNLNYENGFRFFEIDFSWTFDEELVGMHLWEENFPQQFYVPVGMKIPTRAQFLQLKTKTGLTQLSLEDVLKWAEEKGDVFIITDVKDANIKALSKISSDFEKYKKYIIPQVYNYQEYDEVINLGYKNIILTLYKMEEMEVIDPQEVLDFAKNKSPFAVTMPGRIAKTGLAYYLNQNNTPVYVHTVNDLNLFASLRKIGVWGVYTDYIIP